VVESMCLRYTTIVDGTWVFPLRAADRNVRTVVGARCSVPYLGRFFLSAMGCYVLSSIVSGFRFSFEGGGAESVGKT
jgi:hypothetical protein